MRPPLPLLPPDHITNRDNAARRKGVQVAKSYYFKEMVKFFTKYYHIKDDHTGRDRIMPAIHFVFRMANYGNLLYHYEHKTKVEDFLQVVKEYDPKPWLILIFNYLYIVKDRDVAVKNQDILKKDVFAEKAQQENICQNQESVSSTS